MTTVDENGSAWLGSDSSPPTTVPTSDTPPPPPTPGSGLPPGVHPLDQSVPIIPGQSLERSPIQAEGNLPAQGQRKLAPWSVENEDAFAVNQRAAHDWIVRTFTLSTTSGAIQLVGRLRGSISTKLWVPSTATAGVMFSPTEGDVNQGVGGILNPGDSISIDSEGAVWAGVIPPQSTGTVYMLRLFNPPGGGLGLSAV